MRKTGLLVFNKKYRADIKLSELTSGQLQVIFGGYEAQTISPTVGWNSFLHLVDYVGSNDIFYIGVNVSCDYRISDIRLYQCGCIAEYNFTRPDRNLGKEIKVLPAPFYGSDIIRNGKFNNWNAGYDYNAGDTDLHLITDHADLKFGSGSFTVEAYFNTDLLDSNYRMIIDKGAFGGTKGFGVGLSSGNLLVASLTTDGAQVNYIVSLSLIHI